MAEPVLYRKRYIPAEMIPLKDDIIIAHTDNLIITKWVTLHPRKDIARGISAYFMDDGYKVSKIYDSNNQIVYWYCDIIQTIKNTEKNTVIFEDLLIDVILYEDGTVHICDLDELADALELNLISKKDALYAVRKLDSLLHIIYQDNFHELKDIINQAERSYSSSSI